LAQSGNDQKPAGETAGGARDFFFFGSIKCN
jgi:hypothetical protein